ncbi:hypothetical protein QVH35_06110 [Candidatus Nitrosotenuis chungbukensis]|nr:hypothetical protein [Candidatus Nitrosotenuis chungbukensis]WKT57044.1 hypothetical protein QVH35_06110 [Candidatus Nitrosotenuis chungbukensis]
MSVKIKGAPLQYANALRRICLNGVPVFAIDTVDVIDNSSVMSDEGVAHRLGLIPLKTDLKRFAEPSKCSCQSKSGCSNCRVMLVIDSGETDTTRTIYSSELSLRRRYSKGSIRQDPNCTISTRAKAQSRGICKTWARIRPRQMEFCKRISSNPHR